MMNFYQNRYVRLAAILGMVATPLACDDFLDVPDPTVIDESTIDPVRFLPTFAASALQDVFDALDDLIVYSAWFSGEAWVGDTFPTRNDIGRRVVEYTNGTLTTEVYEPIAFAISTNERVLEIMEENDVVDNELATMAHLGAGWAILLEAENFCQVVISSGLHNLGAPMTPAEGMGAAVAHFDAAIAAGTAAGLDDMVQAAWVGKARAHLFRDEYPEAVAAAGNVDADFEYEVPKMDDPSNRGRLGNTVWSFTLARSALVVPPYYRELDDDRIAYELWLDNSGAPVKSQGNDFDFYAQDVYPGWGASLMLASGLEARYLSAEAALKAGNPAPAIALIAERTDPTAESGDDIDFVDDTGTLVQLLDQKARDLFLRGTHLGDWRRNPDSTPYVPPAGSPYYATQFGAEFGDVTCLPIPRQEVDNNPNF
ncbi:MAG TPA: hypothetical protein VFU06_17065 [Longimicrobiales bacterium]|nr:hypothetical protein [Longimicrobiales bacterium]